jgi:hypothetical protein
MGVIDPDDDIAGRPATAEELSDYSSGCLRRVYDIVGQPVDECAQRNPPAGR